METGSKIIEHLRSEADIRARSVLWSNLTYNIVPDGHMSADCIVGGDQYVKSVDSLAAGSDFSVTVRGITILPSTNAHVEQGGATTVKEAFLPSMDCRDTGVASGAEQKRTDICSAADKSGSNSTFEVEM